MPDVRRQVSLSDLRILVVEDEALVTMLLQDMLEEIGCKEVTVAMWRDEALDFINQATFDMAILDVNLNGKESYPVADELWRRGIPYSFSTGYEATVLPERHASRSLLRKPYGQADLIAVLRKLLPECSSPRTYPNSPDSPRT
jgi:CheY-like chemotaxis protein